MTDKMAVRTPCPGKAMLQQPASKNVSVKSYIRSSKARENRLLPPTLMCHFHEKHTVYRVEARQGRCIHRDLGAVKFIITKQKGFSKRPCVKLRVKNFQELELVHIAYLMPCSCC